MLPAAPKIDTRTADDIIKELRSERGADAPLNDLGDALIGVFARMAAGLIQRLNTIPERNLLAFLDMIGATMHPPRPARAPLTFALSGQQAPAALVPAGIQVATAPADGLLEAVFETEQDLVVTAAQVVAAWVRDPQNRTYADYSPIIRGEQGGTFTAFAGNQSINNYLYLACDAIFGLPGDKTVTVGVSTGNISADWSYWDGQSWTALTATRKDVSYTITDPPIPAIHTIGGIAARWVRAQLPANQSISISNITLEAKNPDKVFPAEQGFANGTQVDLATTFRPFGERPRTGDVLYLKHDAVFALKGASITLHIDVASGAKAADRTTVAWEYWNGAGWKTLTTKDTTAQITTNGTIIFTVQNDVATTAVGGVAGYWVRLRLASGDYGTEPQYQVVLDSKSQIIKDANGKTTYTLDQGGFAPPLITALSISYSLLARQPDACLAESDFMLSDVTKSLSHGESFPLFTASSDTAPALYLGLDQPLPNRPVQLYVQVAPADFDEEAASITPASVVWEYAALPTINGSPMWKPLNAQDQTRSLAERGLVSFIGPRDHQRRAEFNRDLFWLRARRAAGESVPQIGRVLTNTVWASHATTVRNQELGSSDGSPRQRFRTGAAPVLASQQIGVREPVPPPDEQAALHALEGSDAVEASDDGALAWVRWHAVPDFYASGPRDRHYVFDCLNGEVRFGDGQHGLIPPQGRGNIRASLYRTGGGTLGNRAAGSITQLKTALAYIASATNDEAASGGADSEPLERIKQHGPHILRHNNRAVAAQDYEDLALEASSAVARALVVTQLEKNPLDRGEHNWFPEKAVPREPREGFVDLVIVPLSDALPSVPSLELIRQIQEYLHERAQSNVTLEVFGPNWVKVAVAASIVPTTLGAPELSIAIADALTDFLHPLTGGSHGAGWPFGRQVYESDLYAFLETLPGVDYVTAVTITADYGPLLSTALNDEQRRAIQQRQARTLIYPGNLEISLVSADEGA